MTTSWLLYPVHHGHIHHWLVAGPLDLPDGTAGSPAWTAESGVKAPVVDLGPLDETYPELFWRYYRCQEDHWVDLTAFTPLPAQRAAWACTTLDSPTGGLVRLVFAVEGCGLAVWINGVPALAQAEPPGAGSQAFLLETGLQPGRNEVLVRLQAHGLRETPIRLALRVEEDGRAAEAAPAPARLQVQLPTAIEPEFLALRQQLEQVAEAAYLDRYITGYLDGDRYDRNEPVSVRYAGGLAESGELTHRLQSLAGDIFQESTRQCSAGAAFDLAATFPLRGGPHHLAVLPPAKAYYIDKLQFERKDLFYVQRSGFTIRPEGDPDQRARQALEHAALRRSESLFSELAKLSLGWQEKLNLKVFLAAAGRIKARQEGSVLDALAALGLLLRYPNGLPAPEAKTSLEAALLAYRYWEDQPGQDGMDFCTESRQIAFHACEILAGQLLARRAFSDGQTGRRHRQHGEALALEWMRQRGLYGFREWDSPAAVELVLAALAQLVALAASDAVRELAATLMDKVLFSLALNSWCGVYGASRGAADTPGVLSGRLEPTSGICRLVWGLGNYNEAIIGLVSLALCEPYQAPGPLVKLATDRQSVVWARERSAGPGSRGESGWEANRVTYRTPDFLLSSVQDYAPGRPGAREHVWQATLGPDAIAYSQHPVNQNVETTLGPNLWAGNGVLPRVVQWGDVLVALYRLPEGDQLGFTHAYFPVHAFDEYHMEGQWAFARKGRGYLALFAAQGLSWIETGKTARRELRSYGLENAWVCHMGQEVLDGDFAAFQKKILAMHLVVKGLQVSLATLRGDRLAVGWEGPLQINGEPQPTAGFLHYENPYCTASLPAAQMDIVYQGEGLRLKFA